VGDLGLDFGKRKARTSRCERDQCQPAQFLHAIAAIVVDVALALHQHPVAARREKPQGKVIGERPAGQKDGRLLAENGSDPPLELGDYSCPREFIGGDPALFGQSKQQMRVFGGR